VVRRHEKGRLTIETVAVSMLSHQYVLLSHHDIYYVAAYTDSGRLMVCDHQHQTILSAAACMSSAGSYVVAVDNGQIRQLNSAEENEFQRIIHGALESYRNKCAALVQFRFEFL